LDEELEHLPQRYRAPLILCYLGGKTRDEAARELGLSPGSLHGRLERGRDMLRDRLTRRDLTLSTALFSTALTGTTAQASLPATSIIAWVKAATAGAGGQAVADGVIPANVLNLMREVLKTMFVTKLKLASAAVAGICLLGVLTTTSITSLRAAQEQTPAARTPTGPGRLEQAESDESFIRRLSKDLRGKEPTPAEIHFFIVNKDAGKRQKLVDLFIQERQDNKGKAAVAAEKQLKERERLKKLEMALVAEEEKIKEKRKRLLEEISVAGFPDPASVTLKQRWLLEEYGALKKFLIDLDMNILKTRSDAQAQNRRAGQEVGDALLDEYLENNPKLAHNLADIARLEKKILEYSKTVSANSPLLIRAHEELAETKKQLEKAKAELKPDLRKKVEAQLERKRKEDLKTTDKRLAVMETQRDDLRKQIQVLYDKAEAIGKGSAFIEAIKGELAEAQELARVLRAERERLRLQLYREDQEP
jgi:hypothetical protein